MRRCRMVDILQSLAIIFLALAGMYHYHNHDLFNKQDNVHPKVNIQEKRTGGQDEN